MVWFLCRVMLTGVVADADQMDHLWIKCLIQISGASVKHISFYSRKDLQNWKISLTLVWDFWRDFGINCIWQEIGCKIYWLGICCMCAFKTSCRTKRRTENRFVKLLKLLHLAPETPTSYFWLTCLNQLSLESLIRSKFRWGTNLLWFIFTKLCLCWQESNEFFCWYI